MDKNVFTLIMVAIICLTVLETAAMCTGTDGQYFLPIVAAISGLVGWVVPSPLRSSSSSQ